MVGQVESRFTSRQLWMNQSSLIYEDEYILLALVSALDVVVTFFYLQFGGHLFIDVIDNLLLNTGFTSLYILLTFKLIVFAMVVISCETLGVRRPSAGRKVITMVNLMAVVALGMVMYQMVMTQLA